MIEQTHRWGISFPKIGIRPTVDGRQGVRQSLEGQTMGMARKVAELLTDRLRYPDGRPVECVISDACIGGAAEAAACARQFRQAGVGVSITVSPCWCYGTETMDDDPAMPKAVWGFNGTERPGAVYLAAVMAGHHQKGLPAFAIYGREVQDAADTEIPEDVRIKLLRFARAGLAAAIMRGRSYLSMGTVSMGIAGSIVDERFFQEYLGMRNEYVDMSEFTRRLDIGLYDPDEYARAIAWVKSRCVEGPDDNPEGVRLPRERKDRDWETVVKMTLIARDLMVGNPKLAELGFGEEALGHHAIAGGFQGQRQWTDHAPNGDFTEAILCSSFDWNGIRAPYILATENDSLNAVSMLFNYLLTHTAQLFVDVRTYWSSESVRRATGHELTGRAQDGMLHLINSGPAALDGTGEQTRDGLPAMKPFWEIGEDEAERCLQATSWRPANLEYFRGGGYSTDYLTKGGMPATMVRVNLVRGIGPTLQLAEGYTVDLPAAVHEALDRRTSPTWPSTWFVPNVTGQGAFRDVYSVMDHWGANHAAVAFGHIGADLITLAAILRIPVGMHNVPEAGIFRPRAWSAFGTGDPEGADFRACANFGPLYR